MKKNQKGFVLLETLIVSVFIIVTFTFVYTTLIPLIGTYKGMANNNSIDNVYKAYHIRKAIYDDTTLWGRMIARSSYGQITCSDYTDENYCLGLFDYLELSSEDTVIFYVYGLSSYRDSILNNSTINQGIKDYIANNSDIPNNVILLLSDDSCSSLQFDIVYLVR